MRLYATGCSFTYGAELPEERRLEQAWPAKAANLLGFDGFANGGVGGASNWQILDNTIGYTTEWLRLGRLPGDLFVVVQWSNPYRKEVPHNGGWCTIYPEQVPNREWDRSFRRLHQTYSEHMWHPAHDIYMFLQHVLTCQHFLARHGFQYVMVNGFNEIAPIDFDRKHPAVPDARTLAPHIDATRFPHLYDSGHTMMDYLKAHGYRDYGPGGYPMDEGHDLLGHMVAGRVAEFL